MSEIQSTNNNSNTSNTNNISSEQKNTQDAIQKIEKPNLPPKKDIMKEKVAEIKSTYEQMIKLRKQNLEGYKKLEMSK